VCLSVYVCLGSWYLRLFNVVVVVCVSGLPLPLTEAAKALLNMSLFNDTEYLFSVKVFCLLFLCSSLSFRLCDFHPHLLSPLTFSHQCVDYSLLLGVDTERFVLV
jgi:hypothetical protein